MELSSITLDKPKGASYYMGCRKVITNLWKGRIVYACVTATDPDKPGSFRLFLCTAAPEGIATHPEKQVDEIIHSLGQAIETIKKYLSLKKAFQALMRKGYMVILRQNPRFLSSSWPWSLGTGYTTA